MAETPQSPPTGERPATPWWVKGIGIALVIVLLLAVLVLVVGGGQHGPGMHTGMGAATAQPSAAALGGAGGPAPEAAASRTIELTTRDTMAFEPASIEVSAGEAVTIVVTNAGQATHEFTVGDAAMQREHADAMAHMPAGMHHEVPNSLTLAPGETKRLTWRFGGAGTLEFACHEPGHYDAGMRGRIIVS